MSVYFLMPAVDKPSWGVGIIYHCAHMLQKAGFDSCIVKEGKQEIPSWLDLSVKMETVDYFKKNVTAADYIIVPEVMLGFKDLKRIAAKKIVFIQNVGYLFESMPEGETHKSLGFEHVFINMPHMIPVVEKHLELPFTLIPPFVADYFITKDLHARRKKQILIYPKHHLIDYSVLHYLLQRKVSETKQSWLKNVLENTNWKVVELKNMSHKEVAKEMKRSAIFVSLNVFESMNAAVVEAMAAGCLAVCYEGYGPRDYLKNGKNALVFPNNDIYDMCNAVFDLMNKWETNEAAIKDVREEGYKLAGTYDYKETETKLIDFFRSKMSLA